jgi:hypothetical protein
MTREDFPDPFAPADTTAGRALAQGRAAITVRPRGGGEHVTLRFKAKLVDELRPLWPGERRSWRRCSFIEASHIYVDAGRRDPVCEYLTYAETWRIHEHADDERIAAALAASRFIVTGADDPEFEFILAAECGRCGAELTNPESIERGLGPDCARVANDARHQRRVRADAEAFQARIRAIEQERREEAERIKRERRECAERRTGLLARVERHGRALDAVPVERRPVLPPMPKLATETYTEHLERLLAAEREAMGE